MNKSRTTAEKCEWCDALADRKFTDEKYVRYSCEKHHNQILRLIELDKPNCVPIISSNFIDHESENTKLRIAYGKLMLKLTKIQKVVDEQAEDEALWCVDAPEDKANLLTAGEVYLQQALRRLHIVIEDSNE